MTYTHLALGAALGAVSALSFARAKRTSDGRTERSARFAGTLMAVGAVAFLVAAGLSLATGRG